MLNLLLMCEIRADDGVLEVDVFDANEFRKAGIIYNCRGCGSTVFHFCEDKTWEDISNHKFTLH